MNKMFKLRLISFKSKMKLYTNYLRFITKRGCETKDNERNLLSFDRKIPRTICGLIRNPENGEFKRRKNADIEVLFNRPNI